MQAILTVIACELQCLAAVAGYVICCLSQACKTGELEAQLSSGLNDVQVDQLLAVQFREDMVRLVDHVGRKAPGPRQTILVSATLNDKVRSAERCSTPCA